MIHFKQRSGWVSVIAALTFCSGLAARAQEKTPFPTLSDKRVYVSGVPDRYAALESQTDV